MAIRGPWGAAGSAGPDDVGNHPSGETLMEFADGELELTTRASVERHLRECGRCRARVNELRHQSDEFRKVPTKRPPMSLRRDLYKRIDEQDKRRRAFFGLPVPSANVLGVAVSAMLLAVMLPQLAGVWAVLSSRSGNVQSAAPAGEPSLSATAVPLPTVTVPAALPTPAATQAPASTAAPEATTTAAPPQASPTAQPAGQPTVAATATRPAQQATTPTGPTVATSGATGAVTAAAPAIQATATAPTAATAVLRSLAGQVINVNKPQRLITVQTGANAEGGARAWTVALSDTTKVTYFDGQALRLDDIGLADYVEVQGFELGAAVPLQASAVKITRSAAPPVAQRPKVLFLLDGAGSVRAPQFGFTGDWMVRLSDTGYDVTRSDPAAITAGTSLKDFVLVVIGYPATLSDGTIAAVKNSKLPILNADPRYVQALGMGQNVDPQKPAAQVPGRTVDVAGSASPITRGYGADTVVASADLYRTPIVSNGTVLATITDGGQRRAVWAVTGNLMYFGFWNSGGGQIHNATYWTLFDRSVLSLLGKDPLAAQAPRPTATAAR